MYTPEQLYRSEKQRTGGNCLKIGFVQNRSLMYDNLTIGDNLCSLILLDFVSPVSSEQSSGSIAADPNWPEGKDHYESGDTIIYIDGFVVGSVVTISGSIQAYLLKEVSEDGGFVIEPPIDIDAYPGTLVVNYIGVVSDNQFYLFPHGNWDSFGHKTYPVIYDGPDGELTFTQPKDYYTTTQLAVFTYITEIIDSTHFKIYEPTIIYFPPAPFYLYSIKPVTVTASGKEYTMPRITSKLKVTELLEDGTCTTEEEHNLTVTDETNYPMLGFYRTRIDELRDSLNGLPTLEYELKIPMPDGCLTYRPHSYHLINPLRAFTYTDMQINDWLFPCPYPTRMYDDYVSDPPAVYGYTTPEEFMLGSMVFNRWTNLYNATGFQFLPMTRLLAHLSLIARGIGHSERKHYYKLYCGKTYRLYRKLLQ
jgi:hypothetical protein